MVDEAGVNKPHRQRFWPAAAALFLLAAPAAAQPALELAALHREARDADPRLRRLELEAAQSALRLRTLEAERLPALSLEGQAQHQSDVVEVPLRLPGGGEPPAQPEDTFDAALSVEQALLDPTREARTAAERVRLAEAQAQVETELYELRHEVNEAFFTAALLQEREAQVAASITDLEVRLQGAELRVGEGVALPGEAAAIEATLLERRQDAAELRAGHRAALARLGELIDREVAGGQLALPRLDAAVADARGRLDELRERPELARLARARERLEAQEVVVAAELRPRLSAYARAGVGRPGLDFLDDDLNPYWLAGVRVRWRPWTWGANRRQREELELEQEAVRADEEAFVRRLHRMLQDDLATIDHLREVAATDARIVELREAIERETRVRFDEQVVTAADYVDAQTDVLEARLARATHRVELAMAQARLLTVLGLEVP